MTITKKPSRSATAKAAVEKKPVEAEAFIQAAEHVAIGEVPEVVAEVAPPVEPPVEAEAVEMEAVEEASSEGKAKKKGKEKDKEKDKDKRKKKEKKNKEAVIIRFEDGQLSLIDARAAALGLARAAWVRMVVARALAKD